MDAIDRKILSLLQEDGRLSMTDLAARIGVSLSTCHRRVRELETSGAIEKYRAVVSPAALGLTFEAIVFITLARTDTETVTAFETAAISIPNVVEAERLFGEPDFVLRVLAHDLESYQELYDGTLGSLPGVQRMVSTLVMKRLHDDRVIPI
ncbi:Lrp/AsnC family transcriptional regulator [Gulosibacter chungangensis]|uniref:Lrp/AsnC family transcriptional regulator n=1 Tax=Gulosibacter chungangensis TaxID=979746 RepID=A0A7J5BAC0_9MICO|nr:Lrp/AsnC family transcriptional regulator [Gulosibacter chungangensis]KAB1642199.1 Lrp/AsnC family transcriptional regulator [Gulosibacter chungangensis]